MNIDEERGEFQATGHREHGEKKSTQRRKGAKVAVVAEERGEEQRLNFCEEDEEVAGLS